MAQTNLNKRSDNADATVNGRLTVAQVDANWDELQARTGVNQATDQDYDTAQKQADKIKTLEGSQFDGQYTSLSGTPQNLSDFNNDLSLGTGSADGNHEFIFRANTTQDIEPTTAEINSPEDGDSTEINLNNIFLETWVFNTTWAKRYVRNIEGVDVSGKADKSNVLELDNTTPFTPTEDYEPATKKFIEDKQYLEKIDTVDAGFIFCDSLGKGSIRINDDGSVDFAALGSYTINYLNKLKKVNGLNISILGDSISTNDGGGNANLVYPEQYWGLLETEQSCSTYINAVGGTTITVGGQGTAMSNDTRIATLNTTFTPDAILVFGGINDFLQDIALGTLGDTGNATSFYGALDYMYNKILTDYPDSRVFHITPLHTTFAQGGGLIPEYNGQNYLSEYVNAIKEVAQRYGVGIIDANMNSGITCFNINTFSDDQIHVKQAGHIKIYETIINELEVLL